MCIFSWIKIGYNLNPQIYKPTDFKIGDGCDVFQALAVTKPGTLEYIPSITDGVHRNENLVEIIPVFSTFSNFLKKKKKSYKSNFM